MSQLRYAPRNFSITATHFTMVMLYTHLWLYLCTQFCTQFLTITRKTGKSFEDSLDLRIKITRKDKRQTCSSKCKAATRAVHQKQYGAPSRVYYVCMNRKVCNFRWTKEESIFLVGSVYPYMDQCGRSNSELGKWKNIRLTYDRLHVWCLIIRNIKMYGELFQTRCSQWYCSERWLFIQITVRARENIFNINDEWRCDV